MDRKSSTRHKQDSLYQPRNLAPPYPQDIYYSTSRAYKEMSESEMKRQKEPKDVKDVFQRFADTTSFQGIPFITAASRWYAKVLWTAIFLGAMAAWLWHSILLIQNYIQFDTNSQVKITFDALEFPTITFCNINPIKENSIYTYGNDELINLLELLRPEESYDSDRRRKRRKRDASSEGRRQTVDSLEDVSRDHDFSIFSAIDWSVYSDVGVFASYLDSDYSSAYLAKLLLQELVSEIPDYNRTQMGHRLGDMLLGCTYDGFTCSTGNFSRFLDINYGNCFSFNSKDIQDSAFQSYDSGSNYGLDMILYLQNREYIKGIDQGRGMRMYIHPFGTQPFVAESGISIPTGFQTYISIRQIQQKRLGGRYGKCGDEGKYEKYYDDEYLYTLDACLKTCTDRTIADRCRCYRGSSRQYYNDGDLRNLRPCNSAQELDCWDKVVSDYNEFDLDCNCRQECRSTNYDYIMSYDQWPDATLWYSLVNAVCLTATQQECDELEDEDDDEDRDRHLARNFIHLKIYYRDLNIERITEVPAYEDIQFYSDIGGAVGLWLGASIITIFEVGDLCIRAIQFCCKRGVYKRRKERMESANAENEGRTVSVHSKYSHNSPRQLRRVRENGFGPGFIDAASRKTFY